MNLDEKKYIKRQLKRPSNKIYLLIYIVIFIIIFTCSTAILTFIQFGIYYKSTMYDLLSFNVISDEENYEGLEKIDHIDKIMEAEEYGETFYRNGDKEFNLLSVFDIDDISIYEGRNIENDNEMICNKDFYPFDTYEKDYFYMNKSKIIKSKDLIGETFSIASDNEDDKNIYDIKVVGTYKNGKIHGSMDTCFVKPELLSKIRGKCAGYESGHDILGNATYKCIPFKGKAIRIDKKENIDYVLSELRKQGYRYYQYNETDTSILDTYFFGTTFAIIIVFFISIVILDTYLKKKIDFRKNQYGILKTIGYDEEKIVSMELKESTSLLVISSILSIIIFSIGLIILRENFLHEFEFEGFPVRLPILLILIITLLIIVLARFLIARKLKRVTELDTVDLLKG